MFRRHDYLSRNRCVYGSWNDGSLYVLCLVRIFRSTAHLLPAMINDLCSTFVSQLVYSAGGSGFAGANGSMMIEVVVSPLQPLYQPLNHRGILST
jgi:hypothetical protein